MGQRSKITVGASDRTPEVSTAPAASPLYQHSAYHIHRMSRSANARIVPKPRKRAVARKRIRLS